MGRRPAGQARRVHDRGAHQRGDRRGASPDDRPHHARRHPPDEAREARSPEGCARDLADVLEDRRHPAAGRGAVAYVLVLPARADRRAVSLADLLADQAARRDKAPAVRAPGRDDLSYAELAPLVATLSDRLAGAGRIGLVLPNGPETAVAFLAAASAGGAVP